MIRAVVERDPYAKWNDAQTNLLTSLYPGFKKKLDSGRIVSARRMWEQISRIFQEHGHNFTPVQLESKWKCLARGVNSRNPKIQDVVSVKRTSLEAISQEPLVLEEVATPSDDVMVSQVVKSIGVARVPEEIMKLAKLKNVPSVVAVYNFDNTASSSGPHHTPVIQHLSVSEESEEFEEEDDEDEEEEEEGVHLQGKDEKSVVHFSQPVLGSRLSARTVAEELCNLREEMVRRQFRKEKAMNTKETSRAKRHEERMNVLKKLLNQIKQQNAILISKQAEEV